MSQPRPSDRLPWQGWAEAGALPIREGSRWGVVGLGVMGRAAAQVLSLHGAHLTLVDQQVSLANELGPVWPQATWRCGPIARDSLSGCEAALVSTGVDPGHQALRAAAASGCQLVGEIELVRALSPLAPMLAITGTNGKSTTTSLLGALMQAHRRPTFVGGNLGPPACSWLLQGPPDAALVLELSSYQLDAMPSAEVAVATVLNVTPDHLERYQTFERYVQSKARLVDRVAKGGIAVLNADDPNVRAMAKRCRGRVWWFGCGHAVPGSGVTLAPDGTLLGHGDLAHWPRVSLAHSRLYGQHNKQNAMAALLMLQAYVAPEQAPAEATLAAYQAFAGLPHRLALVGQAGGAAWLNDSKATNDAAAATAIRAMTAPFHLLLGGLDKGGGYQAICAALEGRPARSIIAFGAAREVIAAALGAAGIGVEQVASLALACEAARARVDVGDAVLLSPACASFDAFANYQARGDFFARWVQQAQAADEQSGA